MQTESEFDSIHDNIKVITISIISVVLILMITFIMKTYYDQESSIVSDLHVEAARIEKVLHDDLKYNEEFFDLLKKQIIQYHTNPKQISNILRYYSIDSNTTHIFSWSHLAWLDKNLVMQANNTNDNLNKKHDLSSKSYTNISRLSPGKIFYHVENENVFDKENPLITITGVTKNGDYIGSLMTIFDTKKLVKRMNERKKNHYTNFAIIDSRTIAILKSQEKISKVGIRGNSIISNNLINIMKRIDFYSETPREFSYINMVSGLNYYVRKIDNYPFVLLINIDHQEIQGKILKKILIKFLEISIYTFLFLAMVVSVYKREISMRRQAEAASQIANKAMRAKTDFLAYTAHEIRSPLGFILTSSEIMQKKLFGAIPPAYKQYIDGINQNSHTILAFINDILDESYIAEGNFKVVNKITDINELILRSVSNNSTRFSDRKIHIEYESNSHLPKLICDERRIFQALNNIISNGIKYSYDDTTIHITAEIIDKKFSISIQDEGVGMEEKDVETAIKKYGTIENKKSINIESYGLGLSIVQKLIEAHGGELIIKSKINVGTKVTIIFPEYKVLYQ